MIIIYILSIVFIVTPFLPALSNPHWFFRTADFVRLQSIAIQLVLLLLLLILGAPYSNFVYVLLVALILSTAYQIVKVFPYSYLAAAADWKLDGKASVSILAANVLQTNTNYEGFLKIVHANNPDLVLAMETNKDWEEGIKELEEEYPFSVKIPKENYYGMHLYSKVELAKVSIKYEIEEDVPSIFFEYKTAKGTPIFFSCLHPAPPSPTENETANERDAELILAGKRIRDLNMPCVICGDMNDVVWSRTSRLFKKMTGMVDPRRGRGFYPTYHAGYRFMRFPLDHLFHTKDLFVGEMRRTEYYGSDHFGMYYELHLKKNTPTPKNPKMDKEEEETIDTLIKNGTSDNTHK